jgi:hypothetical protein
MKLMRPLVSRTAQSTLWSRDLLLTRLGGELFAGHSFPPEVAVDDAAAFDEHHRLAFQQRPQPPDAEVQVGVSE